MVHSQAQKLTQALQQLIVAVSRLGPKRIERLVIKLGSHHLY